MNFPSIDIQGSILSADLLGKIRGEQATFQQGKDFNPDFTNAKLKDEISLAWQEAKGQWTIFKSKLARVKEGETGTTETRNFWISPLLTNLGYNLTYNRQSEELNGKSFPIGYRDSNRDNFPVYVGGYHESLDKRPENKQLRVSPHAMLQEYLNYSEHLYGLVTNGRQMRLLRDASRITRLSYVEFNLEKIMEEDLYSDFVILYRVLHASRMPAKTDGGAESIIEKYHQEGLEAGSTIRSKLGEAVKGAILKLANGFLNHPANTGLRATLEAGRLNPDEYYRHQLRVVYRLLFLFVIEERNLVYAENKTTDTKRFAQIYFKYYSLMRLRKLAAKLPPPDADRNYDLWMSLINTFALFEQKEMGEKLGIMALQGDLFGYDAIAGSHYDLHRCYLTNAVLLQIIRSLGYFENDNKALIAVNYGGLDVEEFGSVYEGLLELKLDFRKIEGSENYAVDWKRLSTGREFQSHYSPEELVQPLIKHSLDYLIEERLKDPLRFVTSGGHPKNIGNNVYKTENHNKAVISTSGRGEIPSLGQISPNVDMTIKPFIPNEVRNLPKNELQRIALLNLKVCDVSSGSGHILLSAARRIALAVAQVQTGEDQPNPQALRRATKEVIRNCIYGVDKNPLAVELCKIALWLEAYNPGEPLNFLDHHIKCGDSIVGLAHRDELENGIADEAFKTLPGDEKEVAAALLKKNRQERKIRLDKEAAAQLKITDTIDNTVQESITEYRTFNRLPEHTPDEIAAKARAYRKFVNGKGYNFLKAMADTQVAQFFIPKTTANKDRLMTDSDFMTILQGFGGWQNQQTAFAVVVAQEKRFFHWFMEFPEVFQNGGFDCVLGNPPFLGGQKLSGSFGENFLEFIKYQYAPIGAVDLVTYFFRRIFTIIKPGGFQSLISTNTIAQGKAREDGLDVIVKQGGTINHAVKSMKWPGVAAVEVALVTITKQAWKGKFVLAGKEVKTITPYLDDAETLGNPHPLKQNEGKSFQGSIVLGKGFILEPHEAKALIEKDPRNKDVLFPYLNGDDLNNSPIQSPSRWVINFFDWSEEKARQYPDCFEMVERLVKPERISMKGDRGAEFWWQYLRMRNELYRSINDKERIFVVAQVSKTVGFVAIPTNQVISMMCIVLVFDNYSDFGFLQTTIHKEWVLKYASALKSDIRYTPSDVFETFPFPKNLLKEQKNKLEAIGEKYHEHRRQLMLKMQLGLTKTYNTFHAREIQQGIKTQDLETQDKKTIEKKYGKEVWNLWNHLNRTPSSCTIEEAIAGIIELRRLHVEMDNAVLEAYGWIDIGLRHDFYEVDYLPENDRIRYTIHPDARKEILKRLLELNHKIHDEEVKAGLWDKKKSGAKYAAKTGNGNVAEEPGEGYGQGRLF